MFSDRISNSKSLVILTWAAAAAPLTPRENDLSHGCREVLLDNSLLRQIADLIFPQPVARQNSAADGHLQAEDRFHKGTLAGAVFSYDAEIVACKNLKIKVLQNGLSIVADAELLMIPPASFTAAAIPLVS